MGRALGSHGDGSHVISKALRDSRYFVQRLAFRRRRAGNLIQRDTAYQAPAVIGVAAGSVGNILLGYDFFNFDAGLSDLLHGQVAGKHIAGVVQNHVQHALALVGQFNSLYTGSRPRSRKNIAGHGDINHALAYKAADSRFMTGAAQRHDGYPVGILQFLINYQVAVYQFQNILIGQNQTFQ